MWTRLLLLSSLSALWACDDPARRLTVQICGDLAVPEQVQALRVAVRHADRTPAWSGVVRLGELPPDAPDAGACPGGAPLSARLEVPPVDDAPWVEVIALHEGVERAAGEARAQGDQVAVVIAAACAGVRCPLGQTCIDGPCEAVPLKGDLGRCPGPCSP